MNNIEERIRSVLGVVLGIDAIKIPDDARMNHFPRWDSLNQMNLMLALEDELSVEFTDEQISSLDSLASLVKFARDHIE
jgi:acyl carrier protein